MKKLISLALISFAFQQLSAQKYPQASEVWEPQPPVVTPGKTAGAAPSDAIILFDGTNFNSWIANKDREVKWKIEDGAMTVTRGGGNIRTRQGFADCQLHIEWRTPPVVNGKGQERGNSGVFFMQRYEVQILDSYDNRTYSNGQAASLYKQHIPMVNATRPPGEWQTFDIIFLAPRLNDDGSVKSPAYVTVFHNGVLVQNHVALLGTTVHTGSQKYEKHGDKEPILLQDHGNPVSFRNIWIREL